jgi:hypothetical protein
MCCVSIFSLHQGFHNMILRDKPLILSWFCHSRPIWLTMINLPKQAEYQRKHVWYIHLQLNFMHIYSLYKKMFWLGKQEQET